MAPEQLTPGASLSERTDVYALGSGAVRAARRTASVQSTPARRPSRRGPRRCVPDVDPRLERVILQALAPDPEDRPASAVGDGGEPDGRRPAAPEPSAADSAVARRRRRPWLGGRSRSSRRRVAVLRAAGARTLTEQDTIVLADFVNTTGEPVFDGALKVALAVALEQSPFLKVFPDDRVARDAAADAAPADERGHAVDRARDRAARAAEGAARRLDRQPRQQLRARARGDQRGDRRRDGARAGRGRQQGRSADVARRARRRGCARSSASRWRRSRSSTSPLPRATTPSLDALHAYSLALDRGHGESAARSDSAPQARDRARPELRAGAWRCCRRSTPTPASRRWRRSSRARRSSCATGSASASGSSSRGATTATRRRPGTRRSSWRDRGRRRIRAKRSRSTASGRGVRPVRPVRAGGRAVSRGDRLDPRFVPRRTRIWCRGLAGAEQIRRSASACSQKAADRIGSSSTAFRRAVVSCSRSSRATRRRWREPRGVRSARADATRVRLAGAHLGVSAGVWRRRTSSSAAASRWRSDGGFKEVGARRWPLKTPRRTRWSGNAPRRGRRSPRRWR